GAARHDYEKRGHPDRSNRSRTGAGKGRSPGGSRCQQRSFPSDHADGSIDGARHGPDRADRLLGANGNCHHGRVAGPSLPDAGTSADGLWDLVWQPDRRLHEFRRRLRRFRALNLGAANEMKPDREQAKPASGFVWLWMLLTFIWFAATSSLAAESIVTG